MASLLQGCSSNTLRALHWTLSTGEEPKRHALLRSLHEGGAAGVMTMHTPPCHPPEEDAAPGETTKTTKTPLKKKQRLQKSQLRLQNTKALQTPLHWLCAHDVLETAGECFGGWPLRPSRPATGASCLARALLRLQPVALLVPDVLGLWPLSHFEPDFCDTSMHHSPPRELLLTLLHGLAELECRHPELLMMLDNKELLSLVGLLHRIDGVTEPNSGEAMAAAAIPEALGRLRLGHAFAGRTARQMVALEQLEQRKDATRWQLRAKETQHRLDALRRLAAAPRCGNRGNHGSLAEALLRWNRRKDDYEERLRQLRFELGRIPAKQPTAGPVSSTVDEVETAAVATAEAARVTVASEAELLIASLRRQRLGGALSSASPGSELRRALGAAVERLAVDLYEMESHFVYELVQNADDNRYAAEPGDVAPAAPPWLRLELHRGSTGCDGSFFLSVNNELGLSPQDVRAICDVNASSKKGRQGVTGHKGIGWKSCFQVSDCPYMLSGAFTFKFDVKALGKLGYVTPTWVGEEELHALPQAVWEAYYAGHTVTYLPLRRGTEDSVETALSHLEEHLPCLLFLRRLKSLELCGARHVRLSVEDHEDGATVRAAVASVPEPCCHRFLMHRHSVWLDGRELILTLAFPDGETSSEKLLPQALYCLLPVRKLGFCFCLDGPFELIASRGDIHEGSQQNQVLCEALPAAFAAALATYPSLAPRALSLLGPAGPEPFWQAVHQSVLQQLHGMACVPLEEGGLEEPHRCLLRPTGLAGEASRLVPSKLLWSACGKRWAKAGGNMTLEEMSFEHWRQILHHRDTDWPRGLCGSWLVAQQGEELVADGDLLANAAETPKEWRSSFQCLFAYLGDLLQTADEAAEVIRQLWDLELLPGEAFEDSGGLPARLYRPLDVVFSSQHLEPHWAWKHLEKLPVLDQSLDRELSADSADSAASAFVSAVCVPLEPEALVQQISDRFMLDTIAHVGSEVIWSMLAVLQHLFLQEAVPSKRWRALGEVLWFPAGATPHLLRATRAVCPSYLGCLCLDVQQLRAVGAAGSSDLCGAAMAACCASGLPWGLSFLDTAYLTYGDSLAWEAFFCALGVRMLRLTAVTPRRSNGAAIPAEAPVAAAPAASKLPQVQSSSKSAQIWASRKLESMSQSQLCQMLVLVHPKELMEDEVLVPAVAMAKSAAAQQLAKNLVSSEWWQKRSKAKGSVFDYLQERLACGASWLRELPVSAKGKTVGRFRQVQDHLVEQTELAQICGPFLPVVRLPEGHASEVKACLSTLGLLGDATPSNLLRCLREVAESCQDVSLFVALYQRLARCSESLEPSQRQELKKWIFVPGYGMLTSGACAWQDSALMQLAEVPSLSAHYGRHGPVMEDYFTRLLDLDFHFSAPQLLTALRRMVMRVNDGEAAVPGSTGLEGLVEMTAEIYSLLSLYLKDHPAEVSTLRRSFCSERLLLLRLPGSDVPKRLQSEEAFWCLAPELRQVESLQLMALEHRFSADLHHFFMAIGVNEEMSRSKLRALLQRPGELSVSKWQGLNVSDVEDRGLLQTSSNFRPPDWRPDNEDAERTDTAAAEQQGRPGVEPDFQPPRGGGPRVPAMRTTEELERIEREDAQRRAAQRARQQQNRGGLGSGYMIPNPPEAFPETPAANDPPRPDDEGGRDDEEGDAEEIQNQLEELRLQSQRWQQESYDLRTRWAQAEDDAERYMKILEQFYTADASLASDAAG